MAQSATATENSRPRLAMAAQFGAAGLLSGAVAGGLLVFVLATMLQDNPELKLEYHPLRWIEFSPASLLPGLIFAVFLGSLLMRRRYAGPGGTIAFMIASFVGYCVAFNTAAFIFQHVRALTSVGLAAGFVGAFVQVLLSAPFVRGFRRIEVGIALMLAGTFFGTLLPLIEGSDLEKVAFFTLWQGGFAATMGFVLSFTRPLELQPVVVRRPREDQVRREVEAKIGIPINAIGFVVAGPQQGFSIRVRRGSEEEGNYFVDLWSDEVGHDFAFPDLDAVHKYFKDNGFSIDWRRGR